MRWKNKMEKVKFEEKMKNLEEIINDLESGDINLDESIEKYTKAMKLINECDKELKNVEKQVSKLVSVNGEEDFEIEEN
jgi:exodeoxyribonuclease VII small subunit